MANIIQRGTLLGGHFFSTLKINQGTFFSKNQGEASVLNCLRLVIPENRPLEPYFTSIFIRKSGLKK